MPELGGAGGPVKGPAGGAGDPDGSPPPPQDPPPPRSGLMLSHYQDHYNIEKAELPGYMGLGPGGPP